MAKQTLARGYQSATFVADRRRSFAKPWTVTSQRRAHPFLEGTVTAQTLKVGIDVDGDLMRQPLGERAAQHGDPALAVALDHVEHGQPVGVTTEMEPLGGGHEPARHPRGLDLVAALQREYADVPQVEMGMQVTVVAQIDAAAASPSSATKSS